MRLKKTWPMWLIMGLLALPAMWPKIEPSFYVNRTPSLPLGIYRFVAFDGNISRGDLVFLEVTEEARPYVYGRGWLPEGVLLLKQVGAVPGDHYNISDSDIRVNGDYVGPVFEEDRSGKPLPVLRGSYKVGDGYFLPVATNIPNSFDGRYFGTVPVNSVRGKAVAVWIW